MGLDTDLTAIVATISADKDLFNSFVNGDTNTSVVTDGGTVPSIAKFINDANLAASPTGNWNASTNSPDLSALSPAAGVYYVVSVEGTQSLTGISVDWKIGDKAVSAGGGTWTREPAPVNGTGQVRVRTADGTVTTYEPTADTNAARGQALWDAMDGAPATGAVVEIGVGVYHPPKTLVQKAGVQVVGSGYFTEINGTDFLANEAALWTNAGYDTTAYAALNISVSNLRIADTWNGLAFANGDGITIDNVWAEDDTDTAPIVVIGCKNVRVRRFYPNGAYTTSTIFINDSAASAFELYNGSTNTGNAAGGANSDILIEDSVSRIVGAGNRVHFDLNGANTDVVVRGNVFHGGSCAVEMLDQTTGAQVVNNAITLTADDSLDRGAISIANAVRATVSGNVIDDAGHVGISVAGTAAVVSDNVVSIDSGGIAADTVYGIKLATTNGSVIGNDVRHTSEPGSLTNGGTAIYTGTTLAKVSGNTMENWVVGIEATPTNGTAETGNNFVDILTYVSGVDSVDQSGALRMPGELLSPEIWFRAGDEYETRDDLTEDDIDSVKALGSTAASAFADFVGKPTRDWDLKTGIRAIQFGATFGLQASAASIGLTNDADFTVYLLVRDDNGGTNERATIFGIYNGATSTDPVFEVAKGSGILPGQAVVLQTYSTTNESATSSTNVFGTAGDWRVIRIERNNATVTMSEGTLPLSVTGTVHSTLTSYATPYSYIGRDYAGSPFGGAVAEIVFAQQLTTAEDNYEMQRYFQSRIGELANKSS